MNLSPEARERHYQSLIGMFCREVITPSEYRDGAVYRWETRGKVVAFMGQLPFKPGSKAMLS